MQPNARKTIVSTLFRVEATVAFCKSSTKIGLEFWFIPLKGKKECVVGWQPFMAKWCNKSREMYEKSTRVKLYRVSNKLNFDLIFSTRRSSESVRTFHTLVKISSNNSDTGTIASSHWNMLDYHYPLCVWVSPPKKSSLIRFAHRKGVK